MKILLVDDHVLFREGIVSLLRAQPDFEIVGEAGSVRDAITLAGKFVPDLVLMDFSLSDGTGPDAAQVILSMHPQTKLVFLTIHEDDEALFAAIRSGAAGYLLKNTPVAQFIEYLRVVERGDAALSPAMIRRVMDAVSNTVDQPQRGQHVDLQDLTDRELDVLRELLTGATNREIAARLVISEYTVKNHISSILSKLHLSNRREVIRYAKNRGLPGTSSQE